MSSVTTRSSETLGHNSTPYPHSCQLNIPPLSDNINLHHVCVTICAVLGCSNSNTPYPHSCQLNIRPLSDNIDLHHVCVTICTVLGCSNTPCPHSCHLNIPLLSNNAPCFISMWQTSSLKPWGVVKPQWGEVVHCLYANFLFNIHFPGEDVDLLHASVSKEFCRASGSLCFMSVPFLCFTSVLFLLQDFCFQASRLILKTSRKSGYEIPRKEISPLWHSISLTP